MGPLAYVTALLATIVLAKSKPTSLTTSNTTCINSPSSATVWGNAFNYWIETSEGMDLTRSQLYGSSKNTTKVIPVNGKDRSIIIDTKRTLLCIIDMQNFFLHPARQPSPVGRDVVPATIKMINAFRKNSITVAWVNWGLDEIDLLTMPSAFLRGFGSTPDTTFGSDMGIINGTEWGRLLMRHQFNSQPWGPLYALQVEGVEQGTDLYFNKNRLSGLSGGLLKPMTPLRLYIQENDITTVFFGGVNTDQCVFGAMIDAYFLGLDVIMVDDISATTSPNYATEMVVFNIGGDGWTANSTAIMSALG